MNAEEERGYQFSDFCEDNVFNGNISNYIHWFLAPSVIIIAVLSCLEKRNTFKPDVCGGRPSLVRPMSFLDEPSNRWGITFVFGSVTAVLTRLIIRSFGFEYPIWAKICLIFIFCLESTVLVYPLFACMTCRHRLLGAILGLAYSIGWCSFEMYLTIQVGRCSNTLSQLVNVNFSAYTTIVELPVIICNFLVLFKFSHKLYKCFKTGNCVATPEKQSKLGRSFHLEYTRNILRKHEIDERASGVTKLKAILLQPVPGFRFPIAMVCTTFMGGIMLFIVNLSCAAYFETLAKILPQFTGSLTTANVIATFLTFLVCLKNLFVTLKNYKRDMLSLYKGDKSFIPENLRNAPPNVVMARGMRYIGTAIVGMFWGTLFCYLMLVVPLSLVFLTIRALYTFGKLGKIFEQFQWIIYPVCMIIIFQFQTFMIGRYLIQPKLNQKDKHRPLAVDNRHAYDIFGFFMLFLNASLGVFTFLRRILVGAFLGVFLIPRMDRSLLMSGYEGMDKCYLNYLGMLMVDHAHNNPIMRVFCDLVLTSVTHRRDLAPLQNSTGNPIYGDVFQPGTLPTYRQESTNTRAKKRWWLAYTLLRNPGLVPQRRRELPGLDLEEIAVEDGEQRDATDKLGALKLRCCRNRKITIPVAFSTNLIAVIVLLSFAIAIAGLSTLFQEI